jgi:O-antigen/teichoic acid export membrane protein
MGDCESCGLLLSPFSLGFWICVLLFSLGFRGSGLGWSVKGLGDRLILGGMTTLMAGRRRNRSYIESI